MKRLTTMCVAAIFACATAAAAQAQQAGQTQQTQTQRQGSTTPSQTQGRTASSSFIGCVEKGSTPNAFLVSVTELPGSTAASRTTASRQGQAQARAGQAGSQARDNMRTQGHQATGTTGTAMVGHRLALIGGTNLGAHVGHKVEITGIIVPQGNATGRASQTAAADMRVNVSNVRMIDANCIVATGTRGTVGTSGTTTSEPAPAPGRQNTQPEQPHGNPGRQY